MARHQQVGRADLSFEGIPRDEADLLQVERRGGIEGVIDH
jgi:hypothetical protein